MTSRRNEVEVRFDLSPRKIILKEPAIDISVQDLHDTLRDIEQEPNNLIYPSLISSAGKEVLGTGVFVGITSTLQNAQLAFQARKNWITNGTVTTENSNGQFLHDSSATFISDGIESGFWIVNLDDGSIASVNSVISETQIETDILGGSPNGNNQFNLNDRYVIMEVIQVSIDGGNLVAVDVDNNNIDSIAPTVGTQVVRTSASSATLQNQLQLEHATFNGGVTFKASSSYSGTSYPVGTSSQPVNNMNDALTIASTRGFNIIYVIGSATIDSGLDYSGKIIIGESKTKSTFVISPDANVTNTEFEEATISGTLDGGSTMRQCRIRTLDFVDGFIEQCVLEGPITLSGVDAAHFLDCWSGQPGFSTPIIDMGGTASTNLAIRNYNGGIKLINKSGSGDISIDMNSGQVILDETITNGNYVIRGIGMPLVNNSGGSAVISTTGYISTDAITLYESEPS